MKAWGMTDVGLKRRENQDTYAFETFGAPDTVVAVVCDGMGGVTGGQLASSLAVSTYMGRLHELAHVDMTVEQVRSMQAECVDRANAAIYARAQEGEEYRGMGTTLVSAVVSPDMAVVCNVGDSRAYHINGAGIRRVTRDHSVVEEMVQSGEITREQARTHPSRNLITRALGPDRHIMSDSFAVPMAEGDCLLLCTDGLTNMAEEDELLAIIRAERDGDAALMRLLELAKSRGAPDNITAVLVRNEEVTVRG
ncbi:MAG: Stp1/IreP family PP2C-type Ser/Thr phosphatase [Oscillospiraceae bacterium]|nr:Stp1/IreP family PP2C-type Ser/Thr phosphatase [Oscillospiraceae bacterium]